MSDYSTGGFTRYHCPAGCTWHHDEHPGDEPFGTARLPEDFTFVSVSDAISAMAAQRALDSTRRVEAVLREHLAREHPGFKVDEEMQP